VRRGIQKIFSEIRGRSHNPGGPNLGRGGKSTSVAVSPPAVELCKSDAIGIETYDGSWRVRDLRLNPTAKLLC
jgi:hypothetical protein